MPEFVRVRDRSTGHKFTVVASAAAAESAYQVLKDDAVDVTGEPLPPEYAATESLSSPTTSGQSADTKKEKSND